MTNFWVGRIVPLRSGFATLDVIAGAFNPCDSCSRTARAVAARKGAAVGVCKAAPDALMQPAPRLCDLRPGSLIRWPIDLRQTEHKRAVLSFIDDLFRAVKSKRVPKTRKLAKSHRVPKIRKLAVITRPECKEWSARSIVNRTRRCP